MFSVSIKKSTNNLEKLLDKIENLSKESVQTGVFIEQGEHPTAGMSYVDLARMHEQGDGSFPPRTVRPIILNSMKELPFISKVGKHLNQYLLQNYDINYSLNKVGELMSDMGRSYFGEVNNPWMRGNATSTIQRKEGRNTPLVDEGYLKNAWAYKTSISDYIVDGNYV